MHPIVSIIIPHFNRTKLLKNTLESVTKQTYPYWEVIIVDDQSNANEWKSLQLLASNKIKIRQRESGIKGPSACRNLGVEESAGEYLIFLDADDLLAPHCLEQRVSMMIENDGLDAGVFLMQEFERNPGDKNRVFNLQLENEEWIGGFLRNQNPWQTMCPIWRKESFQKIGGFDETFFYMEDPDLHLRALYKGMRFETFYHLPPDCYYRVHHFDETKSNFYYNSILYRISFYRKLTSGYYTKDFLVKHQNDIKVGVNNLIRTFLYSRKNDFVDLYHDLIDLIKNCGLFSMMEIARYQVLLNLGNTNNSLLKQLKVKGLCYRLLPAK